MKMKDFLGITPDSLHYYANQDDKMQAQTREKIQHDFNVLMNAGKNRDNVISWLCDKWLCDKNVVEQSIQMP